ncbi:unnamed protein product [Lasius platythorax]|uniref:Uncharacterized protein n=1 Tax=Lasius platythorax TaxID=488582 RepID=A0AAV2NVD3_9HYME
MNTVCISCKILDLFGRSRFVSCAFGGKNSAKSAREKESLCLGLVHRLEKKYEIHTSTLRKFLQLHGRLKFLFCKSVGAGGGCCE